MQEKVSSFLNVKEEEILEHQVGIYCLCSLWGTALAAAVLVLLVAVTAFCNIGKLLRGQTSWVALVPFTSQDPAAAVTLTARDIRVHNLKIDYTTQHENPLKHVVSSSGQAGKHTFSESRGQAWA